ncbi:MAG: hypothetical protein FD145_1323 [Candidatus Saganbacteria bacterium]|uniref:Uncharacterized protein n=1 Tax=Candidatus Saganbacteria bacterium TaxID=2575572 RepID=A0A833L023_UNCSA|nr:MAG: hypothetical protein FD145_1323 [Candidatus Saganbacteria bacterium]
MRRNFIFIWAILLFIFFCPISANAKENNWFLDGSDYQVMKNLQYELLEGLDGNILFFEPVKGSFTGFSFGLEKGGKKNFEIVSVSFNGLNVLSQTKN